MVLNNNTIFITNVVCYWKIRNILCDFKKDIFIRLYFLVGINFSMSSTSRHALSKNLIDNLDKNEL